MLLDGLPHTPPYTTTTIAGSTHTINAQPPAGKLFGGWAHGGPQQQTVAVGEQNVTYTANMGEACAPRPRVNISNVPAGQNARLVTVVTTTNPSYPTNSLKSITFHETRAATVEAPGTPASEAPVTLTYPERHDPGDVHGPAERDREHPGAVHRHGRLRRLGLVHRQRLGDRVLGSRWNDRLAPAWRAGLWRYCVSVL